eukprot:6636944-Lingulodinium_polyedra.AAC.1
MALLLPRLARQSRVWRNVALFERRRPFLAPGGQPSRVMAGTAARSGGPAVGFGEVVRQPRQAR